jgi:putative mRNA 3-end processing factor
MAIDLVQTTAQGLYCPQGNFFIDPWQPVERAVITHGHRDHLCEGCQSYLTSSAGEKVVRARLSPGAAIDTLAYGQSVVHNGVRIALHPAGHVLGSAQVALEYRGEVWVISGDYKIQPDPTCTAFEPVRSHVFFTESTFALPIYRWPSAEEVFAEMNSWWRTNQTRGWASVLYCYALGKAQRILSGIDPSIGPVYTHGSVERLNEVYREAGIEIPATTHVGTLPERTDWSRALILAPMSARGTVWTRRFTPLSAGMASGWMRIRGTRRRRAIDRGFVLSDHVDWPGLQQVIRETGAQRMGVTHGYVGVMTRWLREQGISAQEISTPYEGEADEGGTASEQSGDIAET